MGKSTKWLKNVLLGKKPSKSSGSKEKERVVSGKEVLVTAKVEESDVVSDLPSFANAATDTVDRSSGVLEKQNVQPEEISDDKTQLPEEKPADFQTVASVQGGSLSDAERIQQEIAATSVQAAFRGYLARRAFWALKGIIRLQALIRGHLVRRQAVATLCCVMGIVRLQALARGREIRNSDIGVQVHRSCRLQLLQNKLGSRADTDAYMGIKKLTANAFALKLLASSPRVIPVHALYDKSNPNSNAVWLENWSASCFWKPMPLPKKTTGRKVMNKVANNAQIVEAESPKPKKSVRKVPAANLESSSVQKSFEFEKQKRSFRKVSSKSIEPPAVENPQIELEKVKRSLRKVHNPVVESSIQPQPVPHVEVEKPKLGTEKTTESSYPLVHETVNVYDEKKNLELPEQPEEVHVPEVEVHTPGPLETNEALDSSMVNQIDSNEDAMVEEKPSMEKDAKEDETPKPNKKENSAGKENQKSKKKSSVTKKTEREESNVQHQTSPSIPSYMQATKSAKAKLRLQGSPKSPEQEGTEKPSVPRRHSLPSSGNGKITSQSPRTTRLANSGGKTGNKKEKPLLSSREGNAKTTPVERKRCD